MPATVTRIVASVGQRVAAGDVLVLLEAMKMELAIRAPHDGHRRRVSRAKRAPSSSPASPSSSLSGSQICDRVSQLLAADDELIAAHRETSETRFGS